jgi:heme-degrading monooxygenase HmoA
MKDELSIARLWTGQTTKQHAGAYYRHVTEKVIPRLNEIEGHKAAYVLRRPIGEHIEFLVITVWDSMQSIREFASDEPERAVVDRQAKAVMVSFDELVRHYEILP